MRRGRGYSVLLALVIVSGACAGGGSSIDPIEAGTTESDAPAAPGGRLVIGTEREPGGLDPVANRFTIGEMTYALAVFDPLMALDADGEVVPYLAESLTPDDDHTTWTLALRDGVTFSDGAPLTSAAVVRAFEGHLASELTRPVLRNLESVVAVDERTVEFRMQRPWVPFPVHLTGQLGLVPAPSMLDDVVAGIRNPIGTGPYVVAEWLPGDRMVLTRNPSYWRREEGLPHLDEIELRPIADGVARVGALASDLIDVMQTDDVDAIASLRDFDDIGTAFVTEGAITDYVVVFNTAGPPFDDLRCRRAVAAAIDRDDLVDELGPGIAAAPPDHDVDDGDADGCDFSYRSGPSARDAAVADLLRGMLDDAGIEMTVTHSEDSAVTLDALLGRFEALGWSRAGVVHPDELLASLDADNAGPVGTLAINVGRVDDDELQAALLAARESTDPAARYERVDDLLAESLPFLTLFHSPWAYGFDPDVAGIRVGLTLPGGGAALPRPGVLLAAELHLTTAP